MLDHINEVIKENTTGVRAVIDIFAGSGIVSKNFKKQGYKVYANDLLYFSYVLLKGTLGLNQKPQFRKLGIPDPIAYLNNLDPAHFLSIPIVSLFIETTVPMKIVKECTSRIKMRSRST